MRIDIFDVGHGQCASVTTPNGRRIMIDCGHRSDPDWRPSAHFMGNPPDVLVVSNLDEDHVSDFAGLQQFAPPGLIVTNQTVGVRRLQTMKPDGMGLGTQAFAQWLATPGAGVSRPLPDLGGVTVQCFHNTYGAFTDTNNLSLVTFVTYSGFKIAFAGDLERDGWGHLLALQPVVRQYLAQTNVFVASHHGRLSGCSGNVFQSCRPQLFVISDDGIEHDTQGTADWYRVRASGASVGRRYYGFRPMSALEIHPYRQETRYVVTTRSDKSMRIDATPDGNWNCEIGLNHTRPVGLLRRSI